MTTITISGRGVSDAQTQIDADGNLLVTLPDQADARPAGPGQPPVWSPLRIGFHPTPADYTTWLPKLPAPWFTRVFYAPGKGLPAWGGQAVTGLPASTIRHISFKDRVSPAAITAFADSIPDSVPQVWLTWYHEGDINWAKDVAGYANYWKLLRTTLDDHPNRPKITLINVHTQYASRFKRREMAWRDFMIPDVADVDAWDCYRPATPDIYEDPATLLGLPLAAQREFGVRLHITEFGTHPTSWDTDGAAQAVWYREACRTMAAAGVEAVGFWCNADGKFEYRPTKPLVIAEWKTLMATYNASTLTG